MTHPFSNCKNAIDTDDGFLKLGYNRQVAEAAGGKYYRLNELDSRKVIDYGHRSISASISA